MAERNTSVVLVDDDDTNNFICRRMLHIYDPSIQVIEFVDPESALYYLRQIKPDKFKLLLLDINMPKINAWQFLEGLKQVDSPDIIILTSSIDPKDRLKAKQIEMIKGFWTKPLNMEMINGYFSDDFSFFL